MAIPPLTDGDLREVVRVWEECSRNISEATRRLGYSSRNATQNALSKASRKGFCNYKPVMPGFEVARVTTQHDKEGNVRAMSIVQKPEAVEKETVPEGHVVKGVSSLVGADGRVIQSWVKTREGETDPAKAADDVKAAFRKWKPKGQLIDPPADSDDDLMTVYIINDWHIGLLAWQRELPYSWDLKIAEQAIGGACRDLVAATPRSGRAVLLGLGDLLHADNPRNETEASGHKLDVDGRQPKSVEVCIHMLSDLTEQLARKHETVDVEILPGNHDKNHTVAMRWGLKGLMNLNPRISVNIEPAPRWFDLFGVNYLAAAHGDGAGRAEMWSVMANERPDMWAAGKVRHAHTAHIHHDTLTEKNGVSVFSHQAPVKRDFWHYWKGFHSGRSVKAFTYHKTRGYRGTIVEMLL